LEKRKKVLLSLVAAGLVIAVGGATYAYTHRYLEDTDNAYVKADISPVISKVDGYVRELSVKDNQHVKAGDLLVTVDDGDYATHEAQLVAEVAAKTAAIQNLEDRLSQQRAEVSRAQASLHAAQAEAVRAKDDAQRFSSLVKEQYATRQKADTADADALKAAAQVEAGQAGVAAQAGQLKSIEPLIEQAKADLAASQAQLDQARRDRGNAVLRAAVGGVVGNRSAQIGELVKPGTQLLQIVQDGSAYVEANFKETQLTHMKPGQPVTFSIDAYPSVKFTGVVDSLSPASGAQFSLLPLDNATGNFTKIVQRVPVKVRVTGPANYGELLRPGLSAVVTVDTE
jgi:membrane fusion protein (multidrug efflux system)